MESLTIRTNSVVAPLIVGSTLVECSRIKRLATQKVVELHFAENYVRIIGEKCRKVIVPQKALKDGAELIAWMEERINKAWT